MEININALEKLIQTCRDDKESLDIIFDILKGFEEYHAKIIELEIRLKLYSTIILTTDEYQFIVTELDKRRAMSHDSILIGVNVLNRMAEKQDIEQIYSGTVSKERPYRREVANSVLNYLQTIIENRR